MTDPLFFDAFRHSASFLYFNDMLLRKKRPDILKFLSDPMYRYYECFILHRHNVFRKKVNAHYLYPYRS